MEGPWKPQTLKLPGLLRGYNLGPHYLFSLCLPGELFLTLPSPAWRLLHREAFPDFSSLVSDPFSFVPMPFHWR